MDGTRYFLVRRHDGQYFQGCGYGGPGNPVPYWGELKTAKLYRTKPGARKAAAAWGGHPGAAEADGDGLRWLGFLVRWRNVWRAVDVEPQDFDPNDYEGNNGPIG